MVAQSLGMGLEEIVATAEVVIRCSIGNLAGPLVLRVRGLGIDGYGLASGQVNHHVRAQSLAIRRGDHHLGIEVHMLQQPRGFDDVLELRLTPGPTNLVVAQG